MKTARGLPAEARLATPRWLRKRLLNFQAGMMVMTLVSRAAIAASMLAATAFSAAAQDLEQVRFGTNWVAQAEHGGYYQAVVDGTYAACGLDVEIVPGGPQANNRMLLPVGRIDFYMGGNLIQAFSAIPARRFPPSSSPRASRKTRRS